MPIVSTDRRSHNARKYEKLTKAFADNLRETRGDKTIVDFAAQHSLYPSDWSKFEIERNLPSKSM